MSNANLKYYLEKWSKEAARVYPNDANKEACYRMNHNIYADARDRLNRLVELLQDEFDPDNTYTDCNRQCNESLLRILNNLRKTGVDLDKVYKNHLRVARG